MIPTRSLSKWSVLACLALAGCGSDDVEPGNQQLPANTAQAAATYAQIVLASYQDSVTTAEELDTAVKALVAAPSDAALKVARNTWLDAREPYLQTEVYRFYEGPIDKEGSGPEGAINAWPLDENFIDYVKDDADAGIVNDPAKTIDSEALVSMNEAGGEKNIATGYHAIEFLLWGQDMSDTGPGDRPYTDYVSGSEGLVKNQDRRGQYLTTVSGELVNDLESLTEAWAADTAGNYRAEFAALSPKEQLLRVLTGMIVLSGFETGGERLQTAYDSHDQEDEHSCFSDNTHRDMVQDVLGIKNVWTGSYTRLDGTKLSGTALRDVVNAGDAGLAGELDRAIDESLRLANAIEPPFDQEIKTDAGRARVEALITALRAQEKILERIFRKFGLSVPVVE